MEVQELDILFREHGAAILAYVTRMVGDGEEARDLAQETFTRAHAARDSFRGDSKPSTWLFSIATRVALDHLKSAGKQRMRSTEPEVVVELAGDDEDEARLSTALLLDQAEMGECVRRFIEELPSDQRMALLLHDIDGRTGAKVAEALDCTLANAKIRIHRARKRLRGVLMRNCSFGCDSRGVFVCEPKPADEESAS